MALLSYNFLGKRFFDSMNSSDVKLWAATTSFSGDII